MKVDFTHLMLVVDLEWEKTLKKGFPSKEGRMRKRGLAPEFGQRSLRVGEKERESPLPLRA